MIKRILFVVTTTREALEGARFVARLAMSLDAQIVAFAVVDTSAVQRLTGATGQSEAELLVKMEEDAWRYLYDVEDTCKGLGAKIVLQQDEGFPDSRIAAAVSRFKADMVAVTKARRSGHAQGRLERSLMSLVERVECPVLII